MDDEYFVTAFVPSETACFASSPGRIRRTLGRYQNKIPHFQAGSLRGLNLPGRDGRLLIVCGKLGRLGSNALEDILKTRQYVVGVVRCGVNTVDKGVQD